MKNDNEEKKEITKIKEYVENGRAHKKDKKIVKNDVNEENYSEESFTKALFIKRLFAWFIDIFIIAMIASIISMPFIDTSNVNKLTEELTTVYTQYLSNEIQTEVFYAEYTSTAYSLARAEGVLSIITILLYLGYFVILQAKLNGQTLGKKLMKIKIVSDNGQFTMNQFLFRTLIINSLLLKIIDFTFLLIMNKSTYLPSLSIFSAIQYTVLIISCFMVMFRNDGKGLHDFLCRTKVVEENK